MPSQLSPALRGILLMLLVDLFLAAMDTTVKYLAQFYPAPAIVWARYTVHTLLLLALAGPRLGWGLARTRRLRLQVLRALLLAVTSLLFFSGLRHLPVAEASAISFVAPLFVTLLAVPLLGETVGRSTWMAIGAGLLGVAAIVRPGGGLLTPAALLPLAAALTSSFYQIATRKLAGIDPPLTTLFYTGLVGAVALTVLLPAYWVTPTLPHALLILLVGLLGGSGHYLLILALKAAPASTVAPFSYVQLVWATLFGLLVFGAFPDAVSLAGMAVIVASGLFVATREHRIHREAALVD